ncbi:ABC transporter substrate-binding protein [Lachnospiraceae bacterium 54-53]
MRKMIVMAALCFLAAAGFLVACRETGLILESGQTKETTLTFWHFDTGHQEFYENLAADYAGDHAGVNIEIRMIPQDAYAGEWIKEAEDGRMADVFAIPPESLGQFIDTGKLAALSYEELLAGENGQEPLINGGMGEEFWALPAAGSLPVIFYNSGIYEQNQLKVPETLSDFVVNCVILKQSGAVPLGMSLSEEGRLEAFDLAAGLLVNGSRVAGGKEKKGDFKKLLDGNTGYYDLFGMAMELSTDKGVCAQGHQALLEGFAQGKYAMIPGTTEDIALLKETMSSSFDWFQLPGEDYTRAGVWKGELLFGAAKKGKELKEAKEFLACFMTRENQMAFAEEFGKIPAIRGLKPENGEAARAYDLLSGKKEVYLSCFQTMTRGEKEVCAEQLDLLFSGKAMEPEEFLDGWVKKLKDQRGK